MKVCSCPGRARRSRLAHSLIAAWSLFVLSRQEVRSAKPWDLAVPSLDRDFDLSAMLGGMIEAGIFVAHRNDCAAITDHQRGRSNG